MTKRTRDENIHHPMSAFGSLPNNVENVRVHYLEDRHIPAIPFPHKHDFYQILLITTGKGSHDIDFVRYPISANTVFVMKPGQGHSWDLHPSTEGYVIEFDISSIQYASNSRSFLPEALKSIPDHSTLSADIMKELEKLALRIVNELYQKKNGYEVLSCLLLAEFLILLNRELPAKARRLLKRDDSADSFTQLVEKHYRKQHQVEYYARALNLSTSTLTMRVKRALGKSPSSIIQARCALEAKRLLGYSDEPIHKIAKSLGFIDPNYFSRFFKKQTRLTPAAFRKKTLNTP